jgi:FtsP/CotA-like multicopper oxidase with cupredoxin domain
MSLAVFLIPSIAPPDEAGLYQTFEFLEEKAGRWPVHCHFPNHMEGGMMATYVVSP